jgi:hypothetical protein
MRKIADPGFLACEHHIHMIAGVNAVIDTKEQDEIMIIGLGGGGLCMFLHHCFPKVNIFLSFSRVWHSILSDYRTSYRDSRVTFPRNACENSNRNVVIKS